MKKKVIFYGLLHINDFDTNLNFKFNDQNHKINTYFLNSLLLAKSLNEKNFKFVLLTNNKNFLEKTNKHNFKIDIEEIHFNTEVIRESHFSSCHYRIDVFKYLSQKKEYSALIDLDVVAVGELSTKIEKIIDSNNAIFVNDITDNVIPAYGKEKIQKNLDLVLGERSKNRWYGGDIFFGHPKFFEELFNCVNITYNNFKKNFQVLKDQTDELFISAGIELLKKNTNLNILDSRKYGILDRYWSVNTKHQQESFGKIKKNFLVHFPADKVFLSNIAIKNFQSEIFLKNYELYINSPKKKLRNLLSKIYNLK